MEEESQVIASNLTRLRSARRLSQTELAEKTGLDPALMERLKSLGYAGFSGGTNSTTTDNSGADPKDRIQVYELISDAVAESQHGEYQSSTEKLTAALKTEPNSVPVHYLLGLNHYRLRDYPKAIADLKAAGKLNVSDRDPARGSALDGLQHLLTGKCASVAVLFQRELAVVDAAGDIGHEHQRDVDVIRPGRCRRWRSPAHRCD